MKTPNFLRYREQAAKTRQRIITLRAEGKTMEVIGKAVGVSRQRVHQILKQAGVIA
jgi:DNA-directed RNA polymerase sigma subunit (sigma70/sigma32)